MFGLLNIDKPAGITSRDVVTRVESLVKPDKVGHAGTLDPLATGVLVLCVGRATRLVPYIQEQPKSYRASFRLGCTSETDDVEGEVRELTDAPEVTHRALESALPQFLGHIEQVPPLYSAVKIKGRRAYNLARRGKQPKLAPRTVHVQTIEIVDFSYPGLTLDIECGSGTYIRAIGRDLGQALGSAAVMTELRRLRVGLFSVDNAVNWTELNRDNAEGQLLPASLALAGRPCCTVSDTERLRLTHGRDIPLPDVASRPFAVAGSTERTVESETAPLVAVLDGNGDLVAVAEPVQNRLVPRQVFA